MTTELNQIPIVSLPESCAKSQLEDSAETAQELPMTIQPTTVIEIIESAQNERVKAFARLAMTSLTWALADIATAKAVRG
ncbi:MULTISPECIES: hypothetical protein [Kamptonema]|uniref:hypothetical protein n=1 Tax=Kamptonema TaxID=1501433 RepID=UPI0001DAD223|nr:MULTISPECIES: hypothetical protein [Kamptonema]CBN57101.1 hypothetical protein OSCI_3310034 [Kamptonema sp. PCC 6506]